MDETEAFELIHDALHNKAFKHPDFHSHHEAYGVLLEEVEHVRTHGTPDNDGCKEELADIAAVCFKAMMQLCI